ncbi:autophagy-related protein 2 [Rhodococcoides kroppenstedtii]|uniref:autophagy-related protein 2 n=1 Tax=Rhodococcoides kroppenstedtii TaxID=293050 RepID=UPI00362A81D4
MSDAANTPVDTTSVDPREATKGKGADYAQSDSERDEAIREFDHHAETDGPDTLDRSEAVVDEGKTLGAPDPEDVTPGDKDDKQTTRSE